MIPTLTRRTYALKMLSKQLVLRTKQLDHILCEKAVLETLSFPFIVNLCVLAPLVQPAPIPAPRTPRPKSWHRAA